MPPDQTSTAPPPCPRCSGRWLRDLLHQHRTECPRYSAELGPRESDFRRPYLRAIREPTEVELATIAELGYPPLGPGESYRIGVETTPLYVRKVLIDTSGTLEEVHPIAPKESTDE